MRIHFLIKEKLAVLLALLLVVQVHDVSLATEGADAGIGIKPYFKPGTEIRDGVALSYKLRVHKNKVKSYETFKFFYSPKHFYAPDNPDRYIYALMANLYTQRLKYDDLYGDEECMGWPPRSPYPIFVGQSSLWMSVVDYRPLRDQAIEKYGRVGVRPVNDQTKTMFPRQNSGVDAITGVTQIETISQMDITGMDIQVTYTRGDTFVVTDPSTGLGWGYRYKKKNENTYECVSYLPPATYRIWVAKVFFGATEYQLEFALPDESARYFFHDEVTSFITEFFGEDSELFQIYIWDVQIQREGKISWEPLSRWEVFRTSHPEVENRTYGPKLSKYKKKTVIEISNDGTDTYYKPGDIFEVKNIKRLKIHSGKGGGVNITTHDLSERCDKKCNKTYNEGDIITLTATPSPGYLFDKWSGACRGNADCSIVMDKNKTVKARFKKLR